MPRCSAGGVSATNLPTAARGPSLYAAAASGALVVREIGVFNTTATAAAVGLGIATSAGTKEGATVTEVCESDPTHTVLGVVDLGHSADATLTNTRNARLGAAIGAGIIYTFGDQGLLIPEGTANGVVITCPSGTGQHVAFYFVWDE